MVNSDLSLSQRFAIHNSHLTPPVNTGRQHFINTHYITHTAYKIAIDDMRTDKDNGKAELTTFEVIMVC